MQQSQEYELQILSTHKPEMAFLQRYEILGKSKLCVDEMDKIFTSIWLRRQEIKRQAEMLFSADEYGLIPAGPTRGFAHLLKNNVSSHLLADFHPRSQSIQLLS